MLDQAHRNSILPSDKGVEDSKSGAPPPPPQKITSSYTFPKKYRYSVTRKIYKRLSGPPRQNLTYNVHEQPQYIYKP